MLELFVYTVKIEGNDMAALALLPPHVVQSQGLPSEAVLGEVDPRRPEMSVDHFTPNERFLSLLHATVAAHAPALASVQRQATKVGNGPVYVVDRRTANQGEKPPFEDVLGWFGVRNAELLPDSYNPNPNYRLLSNAGPPQLEAELEAHLLAAIWSAIDAKADGEAPAAADADDAEAWWKAA